MNISATSWPIGMKFYLKHHWGGGKASVCFDPDLIRTLVSIPTDSTNTALLCLQDAFIFIAKKVK